MSWLMLRGVCQDRFRIIFGPSRTFSNKTSCMGLHVFGGQRFGASGCVADDPVAGVEQAETDVHPSHLQHWDLLPGVVVDDEFRVIRTAEVAPVIVS